MGANVDVTFDTTWSGAGLGRENSLTSHPTCDLQAPVFAILAEFPVYVGARTKILTL
jgi:hypothetical protein